MKTAVNIAVATLAALCAHAANGQVVIYGVLDTGVEYLNHTNAAGKSVVRMPNLTGTVPSRLGFRGTESLGGDLSAVFGLETGFNVDSGSLGYGGRLFGRHAFVGLKNSYGALTFGRQLNMTAISLAKADILTTNVHGNGNIDNYIPNARSDNSIAYMGTFKGVSVGATYSLGRDSATTGGPAATNCPGEAPGNAQACRQATGLLAYDTPTFGAAAAHDVMHGGVGAGLGLVSSDYTDKRTSFNGYVLFGATKVGAGALLRRTQTATLARADLYFVGLSRPLTEKLVFDTQVARLSVRDTDKVSTQYVVRSVYALSKRTATYASLGYMQNKGTAAVPVSAGASTAPGMDQTGLMVGVRHSF
ncbi:MAG: porin [Pseudomonadota bacterium]